MLLTYVINAVCVIYIYFFFPLPVLRLYTDAFFWPTNRRTVAILYNIIYAYSTKRHQSRNIIGTKIIELL